MAADGGPMRIGFFGGGEQALAALEALAAESGFEIAFVHPRMAGDAGLADFAQRQGAGILTTPNVNDPKTLAAVRTYAIDLILSINCKQIFKRELLSLPRLGAINLHNGLLPLQRGGGGAYVGIINGEVCGTTLHFIGEGIDDGDIVAQARVEVGDDMTMGELQRRFVTLAPQLVVDAMRQIQSGNVVGKPQKDSPFYYVPGKPDWDEFLDWRATTKAIFDRIRARTPGPESFFIHESERFFVVEVALEPKLAAHVNAPGQVIQRCPDRGVLVKTLDTGIWIRRVRREDAEAAFVPKFRLGAMLVPHVYKKLFELEKRLAELEARMEKP